jgi:hypothetical protein
MFVYDVFSTFVNKIITLYEKQKISRIRKKNCLHPVPNLRRIQKGNDDLKE